MGFTSQDDLITQITVNGKADSGIYQKTWNASAGVAGYYTDLGCFAGSIPASTYAGASLTFVPTDDTWSEGAVYHGGDVSPATKHFTSVGATHVAAAGGPWFLTCMDQIGYVPITGADVTSTASRTITMSAIAATAAKVDRYPNGEGLRAYFSTEVAPTAGGPNLSAFSYKNTAGVSHTCPVSVGFVATPVIGLVPHSGAAATRYAPFLPMAAGDTGISDLESFTLSGGTAYTGSGSLVLHLVKPLWTLPIPATGLYSVMDFVNTLPSFPRIRDGACLRFMMYQSGATTANSPFILDFNYAYGG